jgi:hypothetical protein
MVAALAGASIAAASPAVRWWVVASTAAVVAFETAALRPRLDADIDAQTVVVWRRLELLGIVIGVKLLQVLAGTRVLFDLEFGTAVVTGVATWAFVNATLNDLDAVERAIEITDGSTPLQRIRMRFLTLGLVGVAFAAVGAVGIDGLLDLERPAAGSWSAAPLGYFVTGLIGIGLVARRAEDRRWNRDGAEVDAEVAGRWIRSVVSTVAVLGLAGLVLQQVTSGVTAVPVGGLAAAGRFGAWLVDRTTGLRAALDTEASDRQDVGDEVSAPPPEFEAAEPSLPWLGDVALWILIALIFGFAIMRGRNRLERRRDVVEGGLGLWEAVRLVWRTLGDLVAGVWRGLRHLIWRRDRAATVTAAAVTGATRDGWWSPGDPVRRRIAAAYRSAVETVSVNHGPPRHPDTPREFAHRVMDLRFSTVTAVFEEARYSNHVLTDSDAATAETAAADLDF